MKRKNLFSNNSLLVRDCFKTIVMWSVLNFRNKMHANIACLKSCSVLSYFCFSVVTKISFIRPSVGKLTLLQQKTVKHFSKMPKTTK